MAGVAKNLTSASYKRLSYGTNNNNDDDNNNNGDGPLVMVNSPVYFDYEFINIYIVIFI